MWSGPILLYSYTFRFGKHYGSTFLAKAFSGRGQWSANEQSPNRASKATLQGWSLALHHSQVKFISKSNTKIAIYLEIAVVQLEFILWRNSWKEWKPNNTSRPNSVMGCSTVIHHWMPNDTSWPSTSSLTAYGHMHGQLDTLCWILSKIITPLKQYLASYIHRLLYTSISKGIKACKNQWAYSVDYFHYTT